MRSLPQPPIADPVHTIENRSVAAPADFRGYRLMRIHGFLSLAGGLLGEIRRLAVKENPRSKGSAVL